MNTPVRECKYENDLVAKFQILYPITVFGFLVLSAYIVGSIRVFVMKKMEIEASILREKDRVSESVRNMLAQFISGYMSILTTRFQQQQQQHQQQQHQQQPMTSHQIFGSPFTATNIYTGPPLRRGDGGTSNQPQQDSQSNQERPPSDPQARSEEIDSSHTERMAREIVEEASSQSQGPTADGGFVHVQGEHDGSGQEANVQERNDGDATISEPTREDNEVD